MGALRFCTLLINQNLIIKMNYTKIKQQIENEIKQEREQKSIKEYDEVMRELNIEVLK